MLNLFVSTILLEWEMGCDILFHDKLCSSAFLNSIERFTCDAAKMSDAHHY
jgi:hypothetical protein